MYRLLAYRMWWEPVPTRQIPLFFGVNACFRGTLYHEIHHLSWDNYTFIPAFRSPFDP